MENLRESQSSGSSASNEPRKIRNLSVTREKILSAARRIFAEKGLGGARIDNIAQAGGVNKAMIYYIFKSKKDLYQSVLEIVIKEIVSAVDVEIGREAVSMRSFINLIHRYFNIFANNPDISLIFLREIARGGPVLRRIKESNPDYFAAFGRTSERTGEVIQQGLIRKIDPDKYVMAVMALTLMIVAFKPLMPILISNKDRVPRDISFDEWKAFVTDLILTSVMPKS